MFAALNLRSAHGAVVTLLLVGIAACTDEVEAPASIRANLARVDQLSAGVPAAERVFADIAARVPSFAGFLLEGDSLVLLTTDSSRGRELRQAARERRAMLREWAVSDAQAGRMTIRQVDYSFEQLASWRQEAREVVWSSLDVVGLDLDEARNRVTVLLRTGSGESEIRNALAEREIPPEALNFEVVGELRSAILVGGRPVKGGTRIESAQTCSVGFSARYLADTILVSASHCTEDIMRPDGHVVEDLDGVLGYETVDPNIDPFCGISPLGPFPCRESDAAGFLYSAAPSQIGWGKIWRTTARHHDIPGSTSVLGEFDISGQVYWPANGTEVNKIGAYGGWTYGWVYETCAEMLFYSAYHEKYYKVNCGYRANYWSEGGDSGGPVFQWDGSSSNITMVGINIGYRASNNYGIFSPLGAIWQDFNVGFVLNDPPSTPVTAEIDGPAEVPPSATEGCTWNSIVNGGSGSYTYEWRWDGQLVSTDEFYIPQGGLSTGWHSLTLEVGDPTNGTSDGDTLSVDVDWSYSCPW